MIDLWGFVIFGVWYPGTGTGCSVVEQLIRNSLSDPEIEVMDPTSAPRIRNFRFLYPESVPNLELNYNLDKNYKKLQFDNFNSYQKVGPESQN
jgi:hypothetical protein